jgi:transposase InsO family protein
MAYSINPHLPRARAIALQLLIREGLPLQVVANRCGVHRSTIWRWKQKRLKLNEYQQLQNLNRPTRTAGTQFRLLSCRWLVPTVSAKPHHSPSAVSNQIVERVMELRQILKRCAEVIWYHLTHEDQITISLSSVRRILRRHHAFDGARKHRVRPDNPQRPLVTQPGELVQTDTIHYICPYTKRRRYIYTVIDLYTRMTYAEIHSRILPGLAAAAVLHASQRFGFGFAMVQADNGPEFGRYFAQVLAGHGTAVRHSRLGRPNDNAHIERFNRTIQDECLGRCLTYKTTNQQIQTKLANYLAFYNTKRVHSSLQYRTPLEMLQRS